MEAPDLGWMTAQQACERLRVRPQTLYAYVSRGLLPRTREGRRSRFAAADVEALAARTARGRRPGRAEITIETAVTHLDPRGRLTYRGVDVAAIVGVWTFERTAEWLWSGVDAGASVRWPAAPDVVDTLRAALAGGPSGASPDGRLRVAVATYDAGTPPTGAPVGRDADAVAAAARGLVATVVGALAPPAAARPIGGADGVAARLWPALTRQAPTAARLAALDGALVALADHELAASTLAARVAASTWASFPQVALAGLGALSGPLHGASADAVALLLADAERRGAATAVASWFDAHGTVPGFGHSVYRGVDPRFTALAPLVRAVTPPALAGAVDDVAAIVAEAGTHPNVDLALGAVARAGRWTPGAAEVVFGVARMAGWAAHAIEEYRFRLRFRPRAIYTGVRA